MPSELIQRDAYRFGVTQTFPDNFNELRVFIAE